MLKRDFIMIQIEELAKVVLQIIMNRNTNAARHTPELIQTIYSSLKLDRPTLMTAQPEELVRRLDSDDNGGILRLEIAVKTLIEESYLYPDEEQAMLTNMSKPVCTMSLCNIIPDLDLMSAEITRIIRQIITKLCLRIMRMVLKAVSL